MPEVTVFEEDNCRIVKVGPMGPYGNNAYLIRDTAAAETMLVDMPLDEKPLLDAIAAEGGVTSIVATHWHPDHWMTYDAVRAATSAPVSVGEKEVKIPPERIDKRLRDSEEISVGSLRITVLHTPGHTVGSISLRLGRAVITGDTLFNGGPGKTFARGDLETLLQSIQSRLLPLPEETVVMPGHGGTTTVDDARQGFTRYQANPLSSNYFGDVEWPAS